MTYALFLIATKQLWSLLVLLFSVCLAPYFGGYFATSIGLRILSGRNAMLKLSTPLTLRGSRLTSLPYVKDATLISKDRASKRGGL